MITRTHRAAVPPAWAPVALAIAIAAAIAACAGSARASPAAPAQAPGPPGSELGKVRGEFEDAGRFAKAADLAPEMKAWSAREVCDGLSGATLQNKDYERPLGDRIVLLDGKPLAYADGFGQYWLSLPPGRYVLVGRCRGYRDAKAEIIVEAGSEQYLNFYLERR
jgi:hypothetical protein